MKKIISLALSVILALSSLSFGVVTAFANTKQTAPKISLNETVEAYVDVNNKSYVEFTLPQRDIMSFTVSLKAMAEI